MRIRISIDGTNNDPVTNLVRLEERIESTTFVALSVTLALLLLLGIGIGFKLYYDLVSGHI